MTTTNLRPPRRAWYDVSPPIGAAICVLALLMIAALVGRIRSEQSTAQAVPTPALPVIIIQKEAAQAVPTPAPATPDQQVYQELARLQARIADLEAQQAAAPQPQVVYQPVYIEQPPAYAVPTPEPVYQMTYEPPAMQPQQSAILDRGAWASQAATARAGR
jgi:hypothetical protein